MNPFNLVQGIGVVISTIKGFPRDTVTIYGEAENLLINPDESINQENFDGNWAVLAVGDYGYDQWRKGVAALTKEQPVINTSIHAGNYTLSWDGGGNGDVTQSAASVGAGASPLTVTLADQIQAEFIVPEGATNIRLVDGDIVRPVRGKTDEEALDECLDYYRTYEEAASNWKYGGPGTDWSNTELYFRDMVRIPSLTSTVDSQSNSSDRVLTATKNSLTVSVTVTSSGAYKLNGLKIQLNARLT